MKLIDESKNGLKRAAHWYFEKSAEVFTFTRGNKYWM